MKYFLIFPKRLLALGASFAALQSPVLAQKPDPGMMNSDNPKESDYQDLEVIDPDSALKRYSKLWSFYMAMDPPRTEVVKELSFWVARNPTLPSYLEENISKYPVLAENTRDREKVIGYLGSFPAEWAVRLLFRQVLEDGQIHSERYDLKKREDLDYLAFQQNIMLETATNTSIARFELIRMQLFGWPGGPATQEPNENWSDFQKRLVTRQLDWIKANQNRIPEIVKATWGDKAVLNADLGLGPDNLPIKNGPPENQTGTLERPHSGTVANNLQVAQKGGSWMNWIWIGAAALLSAIGIARWRRKANP